MNYTYKFLKRIKMLWKNVPISVYQKPLQIDKLKKLDGHFLRTPRVKQSSQKLRRISKGGSESLANFLADECNVLIQMKKTYVNLSRVEFEDYNPWTDYLDWKEEDDGWTGHIMETCDKCFCCRCN